MELLKRQTEIILKRGENKFEGMTTAKSMRNWILGRISKYGKSKDLEYRMFFEGILNAYNHFHPEVTLEVPLEKWKGKSSFEIFDNIDSITVIKYQKPDKNSEPKRVETKIQKEEIKILIDCIKRLNKSMFELKENRKIETKYIAMSYSRALDLGHENWKQFFSDRKQHNKLTIILSILDALNLTTYIGGKTKWLENKLSFQESLDNFITK